MFLRPITRGDIGRVAELRLALLGDPGATDTGEDLPSLRGAICSYLERRLESGEHFTVVAEGREGVVGVGSLEAFGRLPHPKNLGGKEGYVLNAFVQPRAGGGHRHRRGARRGGRA